MACETVTEAPSPPKQQGQHAMSGDIFRRKVTIQDPLGFHMRPLTVFAQRAAQFQSTVTVAKNDQRVNGKSPILLMGLEARPGTALTLEVTGPDAGRAVDVLAEALARVFPDDT